jgi:hypothetical protein
LPESGRHGLALKELDGTQKALAHRLVAQAISLDAYAKVVQVMALEQVLRELNTPILGLTSMSFRDPEMYFLSLHGQPQPDNTWGWRLVGHHLSLNITVINGDLVTVTPFLLGAEPGTFGPFRILGDEEDAAYRLLGSLDDDQIRSAVIHHKPPADFVTRTVPEIGEVEAPDHHGVGRRDAMIDDIDREALRYFRAHPRGVALSSLGRDQQTLFRDLFDVFVSRARPDQRAWQLARIEELGGLDQLHFAWAGSTVLNEPHYFRIQGPATLIEFDNAEDNGNHVHSVWRDPGNDFGRDVLMEHLVAEHARTGGGADDGRRD